MRKKIVHYPHPALRHKSKPVTTIDKELHLNIGEMKELMYQAKGLGLAAPQVALPYQLLVTNITGDPAKPECEEVFLNPQIIERKGIMEDEEGCLSFPGLYQTVRRAQTIKVRAYNLKGELVEKVVSDLEARAWQHEVDHLNGVLFIDMMGPLAKFAARSSVKNFEKLFREAQKKGRSRRTSKSRNSSRRSKRNTDCSP
jgi:peptide deformylase